MRRSPYTRKDTFWSKQRIEKRMTIKEIADTIGLPEKKVGGYFTGMLMPSEQTIRDLCELFDVDYHTGNLEFQHAHRNWRAEHGATLKYTSKRGRKKSISSAEDILETLYGTLSCHEFIDIYNVIRGEASAKVNPMKILYQKVDFDTYTAITDLISNTKKGETE